MPQHWLVTREVTPLVRWPAVPSTYVVCAGDRVVDPRWSRRASLAVLGAPAVELAGGHSPFLTRPAELAGLLARLAGQPDRSPN